MKSEETSDASAPYRLPVYLACTAFALLTNYALGKEMASDTLSYHIYAGFSALHDRFAQDYFPAGPQSYFNPYVHVPFYLLVRSGLSSLGIGSVLAAAHSIILWLTYELTVVVCPSSGRFERLAFGLCGVAFALINPILLQQIGSSFADIATAELVLTGWLLLALAVREPSAMRIIAAGLLCGIATGLKLTNAVHAVAGFMLLVLLPLTPRRRIRSGLCYGSSLGIGFLMAAGAWCWRLESRFGNPFFPLINDLFRSPEYTTEPTRALRFVPASVAEALWRPFAMIDPVTMVHEELRAPDPRYAILLVLTGAVLYRSRPWRPGAASERAKDDTDAASGRTLMALGCALAVDWLVWLTGSGNSRYFLPMSSVAAVLTVAVLFRLFATTPKLRNYLLAGIFGIQGVQLYLGTDYRWNPAAWDEHWINIAMPAKLASEPDLYLTIGAQTNSFIAPYLAPGAGLVNFSGLYTLGADGADGARIAKLIRRYAPSVRVLIRGRKLYGDDERRTPNRSQIDDAFGALGLQVAADDCATIAVHGLPPSLDFTIENSTKDSHPVIPPSRDTTYLLSCRLVPRSANTVQMPSQRAADLALDHLEDACPALFQPRRPRTEYGGSGGLRRYGNTDLVAWVSHESVKFFQPTIGGDVVYLGRESDWVEGAVQVRCGRRTGRYFATPLQSSDRRMAF